MIVTKAKGSSNKSSQKIANTVVLQLSVKSSLVTGIIVNELRNVQSMMNKQIVRIKNAKSRIALGLIMSTSMAIILSFAMTLSYAGFTPNLFSILMQRLAISLVIGPPVALILLPIVMRLVSKIVRESSQKKDAPDFNI
jgi:Cu/Ag efflux pump CusA